MAQTQTDDRLIEPKVNDQDAYMPPDRSFEASYAIEKKRWATLAERLK